MVSPKNNFAAKCLEVFFEQMDEKIPLLITTKAFSEAAKKVFTNFRL